MLLGALAFGCITQAQAAPSGTLTFLEPHAVVAPTDTIPVWMRLTLDAGSEPLTLDASAPGFGIDPALVPAEILPLERAFLSTVLISTAEPTSLGWVGPPYAFAPNVNGSNSVNGLATFTLAAGASHDFLLGTFTPSHGPVAPGTYSISDVLLTLILVGPPGGGEDSPYPGHLAQFLPLAQVCAGGEPCALFTRTVSAMTVSAVPEPSTYATMLAGLGLVGWIALRRRQQRSD